MSDEISEAIEKKWKRMPKWAKEAFRAIDSDYKKLDVKQPKKEQRDRGGQFSHWHLAILKLYLKKSAVTQAEMVGAVQAAGCPFKAKTLRQYGTCLEKWGYIQKVKGQKAPDDLGRQTRALWALTAFGAKETQKLFKKKPRKIRRR